MKVVHKPEFDYLSIDFNDKLEAKSVFKDGLIVRYDKKGEVIGIDITDSTNFFQHKNEMTLKEACEFLKISESTMRRRIREKKIKYSKPNGKDYFFKKADILKLAS